MDLKQEQEQGYKEWGLRLMKLTGCLWLLVVLAELLIFFIKKGLGSAPNTLEYLFVYVLRPGLLYLAVFGILWFLSAGLLEKGKYTAQAALFITGTSLAVLMLAWTHSSVPITCGLFVFPVFLAVMFEKRWVLLYAVLLNAGLLLIHIFVLPFSYPLNQGNAPHFMTSITAGAMLAVSYFISDLLLKRQGELLDGVMHAMRAAKVDSLTKLYNHASFYEQLDERIVKRAKTGQEFSLIILDLDNFKSINDKFGHAVGDVVITTLVSCIKNAVGEGDEAFRYGGEEFTILTGGGAKGALALANRILDDFRTTMSDESWGRPITASAGVAFFDTERFGAKREFFAAADEALYEAKRTGKDKAVIWSEEMSRRWGAFEDDVPLPADTGADDALLEHAEYLEQQNAKDPGWELFARVLAMGMQPEDGPGAPSADAEKPGEDGQSQEETAPGEQDAGAVPEEDS